MHKQYHLQNSTYPDDFRIYEERLSVAGIQYRRGAAVAFCKSSEQALSLEYETSNQHDMNAIKVVGHWKGFWGKKADMLGYVPAEVSAKIAALGFRGHVSPRLLKTYSGSDDYAEILFQIVGPKDRYTEYNPPKFTPASLAKTMVDAGDIDAAIKTLHEDIAREEAEASLKGWGVAGRSYKALADIYKKHKRHEDEYLVLERFISQHRARGNTQDKLAERFKKAREARDKRLADGAAIR